MSAVEAVIEENPGGVMDEPIVVAWAETVKNQATHGSHWSKVMVEEGGELQ